MRYHSSLDNIMQPAHLLFHFHSLDISGVRLTFAFNMQLLNSSRSMFPSLSLSSICMACKRRCKCTCKHIDKMLHFHTKGECKNEINVSPARISSLASSLASLVTIHHLARLLTSSITDRFDSGLAGLADHNPSFSLAIGLVGKDPPLGFAARNPRFDTDSQEIQHGIFWREVESLHHKNIDP